MTNTFFEMRGFVVAGALLCAVSPWGEPVPSGALAEYLVHCDPWSPMDSAEACAELSGRLAAAENPSRDERLVLLLLRRKSLGGPGVSREEGCAGLQAISADHPDYADALYYVALYGCVAGGDSVALLRRAAELEPDNYRVLEHLLGLVEGDPPEWAGLNGRVSEIDPDTLAVYREAMYEAAKPYAAWWRAASEDADTDDPSDVREVADWGRSGLRTAARRIRAAALRDGDLRAVEAVQARLRRDLGLDALDYGADRAQASLALACYPALYEALGMEEDCVAGVERLAEQASADSLPLPGYVLEVVARANEGLRRRACAESKGLPPYARLGLRPGECEGAEATETGTVARLRAVLEHHGGAWSSEHYRVHAQGFLGDGARRNGLRAALRADPENTQARCELARALSVNDPETADDLLGEGGDSSCIEYGRPHVWGDTF